MTVKNLLAGLFVCCAATAQAESVAQSPLFTEIEVSVFNAETPVYKGTVVIPRGEAVVYDTMQNVTPNAVCEPNHSVSLVSFKKGLRIALTSSGFEVDKSVVDFSFEAATVTKEGVRNMNGCQWDDLLKRETAISSTIILKHADVAHIGTPSGTNMHMKLIGAYDVAPKGKIPGLFYPVAM